MRVLIEATPYFSPNAMGFSTYAKGLLPHLANARSSWSFHWATIESPHDECIPQNVEVHVLQSRQEIGALAKRLEAEVIHVIDNGEWLRCGVPKNSSLIITLMDAIPMLMPHQCSEKYVKEFRENLPRLLKCASAIITISRNSKNDIAKAFSLDGKKIHIIPPAPDPALERIDLNSSIDLINKEFSLNPPYILNVGGISYRKNGITLVRCLPSLKKQYSDLTFVFVKAVGVGVVEMAIEAKRLKVDDSIIFLGTVDIKTLSALYSAASIFAYPSLYEGFGLPPIEAMSCGIPVISSDAPPMPEVLEDGALFVPPLSWSDWAYGIHNLMSDMNLRSRIIDCGDCVAKKYSWVQIADSTASLYERVVSGENSLSANSNSLPTS